MSDIEAGQSIGNVYVFNYFPEELKRLMVNGLQVNSKGIEGWSPASGSKYTPSGKAVPRSSTQGEVAGEFGWGEQQVLADWGSYPHQRVTVEVLDPAHGGVNLEEDMILLLSPHVAILMAPNGHLIGQPAEVHRD
jgi:hypothetical protein